MGVNLPLTGAGGTTATVATETIGGAEYQYMKLVGTSASTVAAAVLATTPAGTEGGMLVRPIGSTAFTQAGVLVAGSSANMVGAVAVSSGVVLGAGSSANVLGSVALAAGSSANMIGQTVLQAGSTVNPQYMYSVPFSTGNIARTTVNTTVDISVIAANANRLGLIIANASTSQTVALGLSTAAVTTGNANANLYLAPVGSAGSFLTFGLGGDLPVWRGPIRGINITSTTVAGGVNVSEFT